MFHLITERLLPAPAHRLALRVAHRIRTLWWRVRRPRLIGCRVMAVSAAGEVLLVRHCYGARVWMLPGGAVARGETPSAAAVRELAEETRCRLQAPRHIATTRDIWHGAMNEVHVIAGRTADTPEADRREIAAARFFAPDALPQDLGKSLQRWLPEWLAAWRRPPSE